MGCPPDPVEVSIAYSAERIVALGEKYNRLVGEYAEAAKLAAGLFTVFQPVTGHGDGQVFQSRTDVAPSEYEPYADATAQFALEAQYRGRVKELETALCELRTRLCHLLLQRDKSYPPEVEAALSREQQLHLAHREEDRVQAIAWLERQREIIVFYVKRPTHPGKADRVEARKRLHLVEKEIARLKGLPANQLLYDRALTAIDEEKFALPLLNG